MRTIAAWVLCLCVAFPAAAFDLCKDGDRRKDLNLLIGNWYKAVEAKRYDDVDPVLNGILQRHEKGFQNDAIVERAFQAFEGGLPGMEPLHREWSRSYPKSAAAHLAEAHHYAGRAFRIQGDRPTAELSPEETRAMTEAFHKARLALKGADHLLAKHGITQALRIRMAAHEPGEAARATETYRDAIAADPQSLAVRIRYIKASHPRWGGSREQLARVVSDAAPLSADDRRYIEYLVYQELGMIEESEGNYGAAIRHYERSEPLCPGLYVSAVKLAELHRKQKNYAALVPVATRIAKANPSSGWSYAVRGEAFKALRRTAEAIADFEHAVELGYIPAFEELAWFHETGTGVAKNPEKALELYAVGEARGSESAGVAAQRVRAAIVKGRK